MDFLFKSPNKFIFSFLAIGILICFFLISTSRAQASCYSITRTDNYPLYAGGACGSNTVGPYYGDTCPADGSPTGGAECGGNYSTYSCSSVADSFCSTYTYSWQASGYGACSLSCGGGTQTQSVSCQRNDGQTVADTFCDSGSKPATSQSCNTQACGCYVNADCSDSNVCTTDTCFNGGTSSAYCANTNNPVDAGLSSWSSCSNTCGTGNQTRTCSGASCGGDNTCGGAGLSQSCSDFSGCGYSWSTGSWGSCSGIPSGACSGGSQSRTVTCQRSDGPTVADSFCSGTKPDTSQSCNATDGSSCNDSNACTSSDVCSSGVCGGTNNPVNGSLSGWSACSNGTQTRTCSGASCGGDSTCGGAALSQACGTITCNVNADCSDSNTCTTDTCFNGGTFSSYCTNSNNPVNGGWSGWGACSNGTQTRSCNSPAATCGGTSCSGPSSQACGVCTNGTTQACGSGTCSGVQTCSAGAWGACDYTSTNGVSCNDGNSCTTGDSCSSGTCSGTNNPVNASWQTGAWSAWGTCTNGSQSQTRGVTCSGNSCGGSSTCDPASQPVSSQSQACGTVACSINSDCNDSNACTTDTCFNGGTFSAFCSNSNNPVNGGWSAWSLCSGGSQSRTCNNPSQACGGSSCAGPSSQSCTSPSGPGSLTADNSTCGQVSLTWSPIAGASSYNLYRNTSNSLPGSPYKNISPQNGNSGNQTYTDSSVSSSGIYYYWISAIVSGVESQQTSMTSPPIGVSACTANMADSDKDFIAINGGSLNPPPSQCDGHTDALPGGLTLKTGDKLKFQINLCNDYGHATSSNITLTDSMLSLQLPAGYSDFKASYNGSPLVYDGTTNSGQPNHYYASGTTPNQRLIFNLTSTGDNLTPGGGGTLTYEAQLPTPSNSNDITSLFQNNFSISFNNSQGQTTTGGNTPLLHYYTGKRFPTIQEVVP